MPRRSLVQVESLWFAEDQDPHLGIVDVVDLIENYEFDISDKISSTINCQEDEKEENLVSG